VRQVPLLPYPVQQELTQSAMVALAAVGVPSPDEVSAAGLSGETTLTQQQQPYEPKPFGVLTTSAG